MLDRILFEEKLIKIILNLEDEDQSIKLSSNNKGRFRKTICSSPIFFRSALLVSEILYCRALKII